MNLMIGYHRKNRPKPPMGEGGFGEQLKPPASPTVTDN